MITFASVRGLTSRHGSVTIIGQVYFTLWCFSALHGLVSNSVQRKLPNLDQESFLVLYQNYLNL